MSVIIRRRAPARIGLLDRVNLFEWSEVCLKRLYLLLMAGLLLDFLCRMFFSHSMQPVLVGRVVTGVLGIWLGKTWKDRGFRFMSCYLLWMVLRCFVCVREASDRTAALNRILALFWAVGGCYSLGRILNGKQLRSFLAVVCLVWTAGMAVSSCLGITAAWMRIRIPNLSGNAWWKIWGDASSARLNLTFTATVSGGILSASVLLALAAGFSTRKPLLKAFFFTAVFPMILALCLTDSRTAQISLSVGIAALFFVFLYARLHPKGSCESVLVPASRKRTGWKRIAILFILSLLVCILVFSALLHVNPLFDTVKIACTRLGILPSAAVTDETTVLMSHRGIAGENALTGRDQIWKAAVSYLSDHPRYLLYGASIVEPMARILDQSLLSFETIHCHNILLQVLVEGGLPALLMFLGFVLYLCRGSVRLLSGANRPLWLILLPCLILSMFVGDMGECLTWLGRYNRPLPFILFLLAGLVAASSAGTGPVKRGARLRSFLVFPVVCVLLVGSLAPFLLRHTVPVIRQDDYDDPVADLYYECGDINCETHHGRHTIKTSGCGLCAISNAVRYMTGQEIDVRSLAAFARENDQYIVHVGSKSTISEESAKALGSEYGFAFIGKVEGLAEATAYVKLGCTVIAGVGNSKGGGHLLVIADYDPLTKEYLILDSAGNYESWSRSFSSWQRISNNCMQSNPDVYFTSFRILAPSRLSGLSRPDGGPAASQTGKAE